MALIAFYALDRLASATAYGPGVLLQGLLVHAGVLFCLAQGVWGAFMLAAVERDRPGVPPRTTEPAV